MGIGAEVETHVEDITMRNVEGQNIVEGLMKDAGSDDFSLETPEVIMGTASPQALVLEQQAGNEKPIEDDAWDTATVSKKTDAFSTAPLGIAFHESQGEETVADLVGEQDSAIRSAMYEQGEGGLAWSPTEKLGPGIPGMYSLHQHGTAHNTRRVVEHFSDAVLPAEEAATEAVRGTVAGDEARVDAGVNARVEAVASIKPVQAGDPDYLGLSETTTPGSVYLEPPQLEAVKATVSNVMRGNEPMEVDTATPIAPEYAMPDLLPTGQDSMAQDYGLVEHGDIQPCHADIAEAAPENMTVTDHGDVTTADLQTHIWPDLDATNGWLRINIPDHFKKVRNQLYYLRSQEGFQAASRATSSRSRAHPSTGSARKPIKIKFNLSSRGKAQDDSSSSSISSSGTPGAPNISSPSSAAVPWGVDTPPESRTTRRSGGLYDGAIGEEERGEGLTWPVDAEEEVLLLADPPEVDDDVGVGQQLDGLAAAAVDGEDGVALPGADCPGGLASSVAGEAAVPVTVVRPAAGRVTRSRVRGRGCGQGRGRTGRSLRSKGR